MYFSRITLHENVELNLLARLASTGGYQEHQMLWKLFAGEPAATRDFLFRREPENGQPRYFMISGRPPADHSGLWRIDPPKRYEPKLRTGQHLAFMLRVNPVVSRKNAAGKSCRHDVVMDTKTRIGYRQLAAEDRPALTELIHDAGTRWIEVRAGEHGFQVQASTLRVDGYAQHRTWKRNVNRPIRFSTLDLAGVLLVTDPDAFGNTLFHGIGPAKAFGCGMMLVRPC